MSENHLTSQRFDELDLPDSVLQGVRETKFEYCTPIQAATLPLSLAGKDVAGQAQTGTGKTAAFLLATLTHLIRHPADDKRKPTQPRAIILSPTRELAIQIFHDAEKLATGTDFKLCLVYGGTGYEQQRKSLQEGVDILIGTPGRLIDYFKQHIFDLRAIQVMVLDEADRMFDLGFIKDIRYLIRRMPTPDKRLSMLFSATLSLRVTELAYEHMNNPETVVIESESVTADKVTEVGYMVANDEKIPLLIGLLRKLEPTRGMVFVNTKRAAERVWGFLEGNDFKTGILTGDVPQKKRQRLLKAFQDGELAIMVATDVAARGLHISGVTHVFNYDLPDDAQDYVHRIGRTARAGATGDALSFVCETYAFSLPDIEAFTGHKITMKPVSNALLAEVDPKSRIYLERKPRGAPRGRHGQKPRGAGSGDKRQRRPRGRKPKPTATES